MRRTAVLVTVACLMVLGSPDLRASADVPTVDIGDLIAEMDLWDGQEIAVVGELVGDYSRRNSGVWVQINDDPYVGAPVGNGGEPNVANTGIGARIPTDIFDAARPGPPGRNGRIGPVVEAIGVFHHNDPALGGETYLEVRQLITVSTAVAYPIPGPDIWLWIGLALLALAAVISFRTRQRTRVRDADG